MNYAKAMEIYLGRNVDFETEVICTADNNGWKIAK